MKLLLYALFASVFSLDYLAIHLGLISRKLTLLPEILSIIAAVLVVVRATLTKRIYVHAKYIILFGVLVALVISSAIVNEISAGTIIVGMRIYFKYLPFFLVPAVFDFSEDEMRAQLKILLVFSLLQFPLTVYQRMSEFRRGILSGDAVSGTLNVSSILSIYLICNIAILVGFYLRKRISKVQFFILIVLLFIPTTINETKGTLILLPIAVFVPVLLMSGAQSLAKRMGPVVFAAALIGGIFVPVYNNFMVESEYTTHGENITDFFSSQGNIEHYLYGGAASAGDVAALKDNPNSLGLPFSGTEERVGRIDGMYLPLRLLSSDLIKLLLGLGVGNVSISFISEFSGRYSVYSEYYGANVTVISLMLWETGILGVALAVIALIFVFMDARSVSASDDFPGALALGWMAVALLMIVVMPYKNVLNFNVIGYLFWYFSGYIAAQRMRMSR